MPSLTGPDNQDVHVTVGVDSHANVHVAAALDQLGRLLGTHSAPTTRAGYAALIGWTEQFGTLVRVGIEGTGSYGAGLTRWLRARGHAVVEVERPKRQTRRRSSRSDPIDAEVSRPCGAGWHSHRTAEIRCRPDRDDPQLAGRAPIGTQGQDSGRQSVARAGGHRPRFPAKAICADPACPSSSRRRQHFARASRSPRRPQRPSLL